jgi:CelD/BcsL family acetyltransferase involved in cellulose biosynthesis
MASEIQVLNCLDSFSSVEQDWRRLQESAVRPNVYFTFEWLKTLLARNRRRRLWIAVARDEGRLVAALPLWQPSRLLPILEPIGSVPLNDPPVLSGYEGVLADLIRHTLEVDPRRGIVMRNLGADSPLALLSGARVTPQKNPELFTSIAGDFTSFVSRQFQRKSRNKVRRYAEQLRRAGATFEMTVDPRSVVELAVQMAPLKWQVLKSQYNTSQVCFAAGRAFLADLANAGLLRGYALRLDGNLVAACLCQLHRGVLWYWIPAYNPDFVRWSPGIALLYDMLEHAHLEGLREVNFGYGEQMYKDMWATGSRPLVTFEIAADSIRAHRAVDAWRALDRVRNRSRRVGGLQRLNAQLQWLRTRRERAVVAGGLTHFGRARSLLQRARAEGIRPAPRVLMVVRASNLAADAQCELDFVVAGTTDYQRVVSMRPWEAPATSLEHFRHGDTCFVAQRHGADVHASFVDWNPHSDVPVGYAYVHRAFTIPSPDRWDIHCEVLRRIAREAVAHGKLGIACTFDASNAELLRRANLAGFEQVS